MIDRLHDVLRMIFWPVAGVLLYVAAKGTADPQLQVLAIKCGNAAFGGYCGYWMDRLGFPYARPDRVSVDERPKAYWRRAIIMGSVILGVTLGL